MGDQNPQDFAEKVLQSLKKSSRAVDLSDNSDPNVSPQSVEPVEPVEPVVVSQQSVSRDFTAYGAVQAGGLGPGSGGNKDLVIIPGYTGTAATSVSQVNFYWSAPTTPDSTGVDNNVRATIYNYATNPGSGVTHPVFVFGGYNGTSQYKPHPTYGGGSGVTAKVWLDPFIGKLDIDFIGLNTTGVGATSDAGVMSYDSTQNKIRVGTGSGTAKTVAFTDDVTAASGLATTATNVHMAAGANAASHYLAFSLTATGAGVALSSDTDLTYNPNTNVLTASTFSGALTGTATTSTNVHLAAGANNASHSVVFSLLSSGAGIALSSDGQLTYNPSTDTLSATNISGALTGNVTGTATTSTNVHLAAGANNASHSVIFSLVSAGAGIALSSDAQLTYNPSTDTLSAATFSGAFSGNVTGNLTGNVTGTATTATNIHTVVGSTNATHYVTFSPVTSGSGVAISTDGQLTYNPSTDTLSATTFSGAFSGNVTGNLTGNVTGTATTATNVHLAAGANNASHSVVFSLASTGSGVALSSDAQLTYNPSTDTLSASTFSGAFSGNVTGNLTGNVTGTATTATNLHLQAASTNTTHYITFSPVATGAGTAHSSDTDLTYNPSTNVLTAVTFSGALTGNVTGTATTATNLNTVSASTNTNHFVLFSTVNGGSGVAVSSDAQLTYNPSTDTLSATNFSGSFSGTISGTASTAASLNVNATSQNALHYILISPTASGSGVAVSSDSTFTINPSNNLMSIGTGSFAANGVTVGSASNTINTASGNLTLDSVGGQTNINDNLVVQGNLTVQGTTITVDSTISTIVDPVIVVGSGVGGTHSTLDNNQDRGIEFRWSNAGVATTGFFGFQDTDFKFRFIPNATLSGTNVYSGTAGTAVFFQVEATLAGNAAGTAATYTNFFGTLTGNVTGTATTATNVNLAAGANNASHSVVFSLASSGAGVALSSDTQLTYNPSTDTLSSTNFSGALTGNVTGTATTSTNVHAVAAATNASHFITFSPVASGAGVAISTDAQLTYNPSTDTLSATTFSGAFSGTLTGNVTGTATTSTNVHLAAGANNASHSVVFSLAATGAGVALSSDAQLTYNPSTDTLSASTFSGAFSGNVTGNLTGNVTGTATTATNVHAVAASTNATHYVTFSPVTSGSGVAISTDGQLTYNPSTDTLSATTFSGAFSGNVTGNLTGNVTGTATTATNIHLAAGANNTNHSVVFSLVSAGAGVALSSDAQLTYNPSTDTLNASTFSGAFSGNVTGNLTGNVTGTATTATNLHLNAGSTNAVHYITFSPVATGAGTAHSSDTDLTYNPSTNVLTAVTFSGALTGNVTGTATTATNVNLAVGANNANHSVIFSLAASGAGVALSSDTTLLYNPSTDTLSSTTFAGALTGNAATATTSANVNVVNAAAATAHYLLFSPTQTGSGVAVSSDSTLTYVPSTDTISVTNISPTTITSTSALTSGTYLTVKTNASDDSSTTDFFLRGVTSGDVSKFSVDANGNLRATTKSFDIPHPTKDDMRLVYGVLEGPEHGVYHRGTVEGKGNLLIELPDYWSELVNEDFTVSLTPHGNYGVHIVEKSLNSFIISLSGNIISKKLKTIKVDYLVHGSRKDAPLIIEQPA